jgi:hypothetical protein
MHLIFAVIVWIVVPIVSLVILYYVIRTAVRDGIMDAWRIRKRSEKEARDDQAQGW